MEEPGLLYPKARRLQVLDLSRYLNLVGRERKLLAKILTAPKPDDPDRHERKKAELLNSMNHPAPDDKSSTTASSSTTTSTTSKQLPQKRLTLLGEVIVEDEEPDALADLIAVPTLDDSEELGDDDVAFPCLTTLALPLLHVGQMAWILKHYTTLTSLSLGDNEISVRLD